MSDLYICFMWAFAEAIFWPFMPDAVLVPLAALHPSDAWLLVPMAIAGSATGAAVSYLIGLLCPPETVVERLSRLPCIRRPMIDQARRWLQTEGPRGVAHQPLSFIPFKVFAFLAGMMKVPLLPFLGWAMLVRATRFVLVCAIAAAVGALFGRWLYRVWNVAVVVWAIVFWLGLRRMVRHWERQPDRESR